MENLMISAIQSIQESVNLSTIDVLDSMSDMYEKYDIMQESMVYDEARDDVVQEGFWKEFGQTWWDIMSGVIDTLGGPKAVLTEVIIDTVVAAALTKTIRVVQRARGHYQNKLLETIKDAVQIITEDMNEHNVLKRYGEFRKILKRVIKYAKEESLRKKQYTSDEIAKIKMLQEVSAELHRGKPKNVSSDKEVADQFKETLNRWCQHANDVMKLIIDKKQPKE